MSIASLGIIGGLAGTPLPQRAAASESVQQGQGEQSRAADAVQRAEAAAGIGTTEEDAETSDRDADGRRLWEQWEAPPDDAKANAEAEAALRAKDPSGTCGGEIDLLG